MKFTIERSEFLGALLTAAKALPQKSPNPALDGVYIEARPDGIVLICTNSSMQIETHAPAAVDDGGKLLLPGRLLNELIRRLPDGDVSIEEKTSDARSQAVIRCGGFKSQIQAINSLDFPEMPVIHSEASITIPQKLLKSIITRTSFAVATDESRPILTGVLFEGSQGNLKTVALDGYRFASARCDCQCTGDFRAVIPANVLSELGKELLDDDTPVTVNFNRTNAFFDMGVTRINTLLLVGEFMKYDQIIPKDRLTCVRINRRQLYDAIERASLMARESKNNLVKLNIEADYAIISSNSEVGSVREEIHANVVGGDLEIAFNAKYLTDVLKALDDDEVQLVFNTNITPCVIEPVQGSSYLYLVLPVRLYAS